MLTRGHIDQAGVPWSFPYLHNMNTLIDFARSASSSGLSSDEAEPGMYQIRLMLRNDEIIKSLGKIFTFCIRSPLLCATLSALNWAVTTPTRLPLRSSSGPPLLPACTGVDICIYRESSPIP